MKQIKLGSHVKAAFTSKHVGYTGTVVNADGSFLTIREDTDKPNPLSYKSVKYPDFKVFQLDKRLATLVKSKK